MSGVVKSTGSLLCPLKYQRIALITRPKKMLNLTVNSAIILKQFLMLRSSSLWLITHSMSPTADIFVPFLLELCVRVAWYSSWSCCYLGSCLLHKILDSFQVHLGQQVQLAPAPWLQSWNVKLCQWSCLKPRRCFGCFCWLIYTSLEDECVQKQSCLLLYSKAASQIYLSSSVASTICHPHPLSPPPFTRPIV